VDVFFAIKLLVPVDIIFTSFTLSFVDTLLFPEPSSILLMGNIPMTASSNCYLLTESVG